MYEYNTLTDFETSKSFTIEAWKHVMLFDTRKNKYYNDLCYSNWNILGNEQDVVIALPL